jgi:hypothetical protein
VPPGVCGQRMVAFMNRDSRPQLPSSNLMLRYFIKLHQWLSWNVESGELCHAMIDKTVDSDIDHLSLKLQHWPGMPRE